MEGIDLTLAVHGHGPAGDAAVVVATGAIDLHTAATLKTIPTLKTTLGVGLAKVLSIHASVTQAAAAAAAAPQQLADTSSV